MYKKEYLGFKAALYTEGELEPLWAALEKALED